LLEFWVDSEINFPLHICLTKVGFTLGLALAIPKICWLASTASLSKPTSHYSEMYKMYQRVESKMKKGLLRIEIDVNLMTI
jgi:hypothetical protein